MTALPAIGTYLRPVGRQCPIRQGYGHRKVRAGRPPDNTGCLPVDYTQAQLDAWHQEEAVKARTEREAARYLLLLVAGYIAAIMLCIAALAVWGNA
jgi:hypothetical protein